MLLIVCLMIAIISVALVYRRSAIVVRVAIMPWRSCLVMFVSLFLMSCFDNACLLFFWYLSRVFRSALSDVLVLCSTPAIVACVLESLHFCLSRGHSWGVCRCGYCAVGASLGPCVLGEWVP